MTREEAIARGVEVQPTMHSMKRRCQMNDYREPGIYMLTMAVEGRRRLLGRLVGDAMAPMGSDSAPRIELNQLGMEVEEIIKTISCFHPEIEVWRYAIMEDHIHVLIRVVRPLEKHLGKVVGAIKGACSKAYWRSLGLPSDEQNQEAVVQSGYVGGTDVCLGSVGGTGVRIGHVGGMHSGSVGGTEVPAKKEVAKKEAAKKKAAAKRPPLFEEGYNDRILYRAGQLEALKKYIADNPRRLAVKRQFPHLFRKYLHVRIGRQEYAAYGNIFLLRETMKAQVIVHRRDTAEEHEAHMKEWKRVVMEGGVLVSPFISPREKEVREMARECGGDMIILRENGFPDIFKPSGWEFDYCAEGRLLLLAPWPHHMERNTITRSQCLSLNDMAKEICSLTMEDACVKDVSYWLGRK